MLSHSICYHLSPISYLLLLTSSSIYYQQLLFTICGALSSANHLPFLSIFARPKAQMHKSNFINDIQSHWQQYLRLCFILCIILCMILIIIMLIMFTTRPESLGRNQSPVCYSYHVPYLSSTSNLVFQPKNK